MDLDEILRKDKLLRFGGSEELWPLNSHRNLVKSEIEVYARKAEGRAYFKIEPLRPTH